MKAKTTRAFRTISEAGDELGLQPHVLRFWESKFSDIKPIKRGGGRRFYRPEDIEFLRGIKILLHDEKHPIKDVQKLIRVKGSGSVISLGQSVQKASQKKKVAETVLIPERIQKAKRPLKIRPIDDEKIVPFVAPVEPEPILKPILELNEDVVDIETLDPEEALDTQDDIMLTEVANEASVIDRPALEDALSRLNTLRSKWVEFKGVAS